MNKENFLAVYARLLAINAGWATAPDKLAKYMASVRETIFTERSTANLAGSQWAEQAWRTIGGKGRLTYKALRALPNGEVES